MRCIKSFGMFSAMGLLLIAFPSVGEPASRPASQAVSPCYATAATQTYKEGDSVPCSARLDGVQRISKNELDAGEDTLNNVQRIEEQFEYETVAASQTDQVMGSTGAAGDLLAKLHCVFSAAAVGAVQIKDGTGSAITVIDAKAAATAVTVEFSMVSTDAGWKITTGTNTTCIGIGRFS